MNAVGAHGAEARGDAGRHAVIPDFPEAAVHAGRQVKRAVVDLLELEIALRRTERDAVVEVGQDIVETKPAGDAPTPYRAGLKHRAAHLRSAAQSMEEGHEAALGIAQDGPGLGGVHAVVVGTLGECAAFELQADVLVVIPGNAADEPGADALVLKVVDVGVEGAEVAVLAGHVQTRRRDAARSSHRGLSQGRAAGQSGEAEQGSAEKGEKRERRAQEDGGS